MMVFLHIPKTAGTTFQFILENSLGLCHCHTGHLGRKIVRQQDLDFAKRCFVCLRSVAGENLVAPWRLSVPAPFFMTFVRDPVARVFSHFQDTVLRGGNRMSFEQTLRSNEEFENLHVKLLAGERNLDRAKRFLEQCGFVGLTERFDLSLHVLDRLSPHKLNLNYKRKLAAPDNSIRKSLEADSRMVELTREFNQLDLELYAFAVNEVFPRLCAKAGYGPADKVATYDRYTTEVKPRFLLHRLYNMSFFRQLCKLRNRFERSEPPKHGASE